MKKFKYDIIIFLIVIIILGGALLAFSPGLMSSDVLDQLNQMKTKSFSDAHPIFHTFVIGVIYKITGSITGIAIFQILMFAILWTYACKIIRKENESNLNIFFQIILTIIVCIVPINFLYSITLWKDILYTYALFGTLIFIYIGIKNKFNYTYFQMVMISIFLALFMRFRHNGFPVGVILFAIIFVFNIINNKKKLKSLIFLIIFLAILFVSYIPKLYFKPSAGLTPTSTLTSTKVYCMGALLNQEISLTEEESEFLNNIIPIEEWKNGYDLYSGGRILFNENYNKKYLNENMDQFDEIFKKYSKMFPKVLVKHFIEVNSMFWSIGERGYIYAIITSNNDMNASELWQDEYTTSPKSDILYSLYSKIIEVSMNNKILYAIIYRPATLMYISIILVLLMWYKSKNWLYLLLIFPMGLNIGTYLPFIASQDLRYAYPNYLTTYFIILIYIGMICKKKYVKDKNIKKRNIKKKVVVIPAYNEEKSIKQVVENIYKCTNDCDVVVINDGSKDKTYEEALKTKATVINLPNNLGIGGAVQTGYLYAYKNNYDIAIQVDADGQHDPKYINQMIELIKNGQADMVIGSRFIEKTSYKQTFFRMLGINITSGIIKFLTDEKIYDTTSGFRAINKEIIEEFAKEYPYDYPEPCTNMEMILKGKNIMEIPVEMKYRTTGTSSISPIKSVKYMLKVMLSLFLMKIKKY